MIKLEQLQGAVDLGADILGPGLGVFGCGGFGFESLVGGWRTQHQVHFTQALTEQTGKIRQFAEGVVVLFLFRDRVGQLIADRALQVVLGPAPGIALIAQVTLGNHQQVVLPLPVAAAHKAQQRRDIRVAGGGQVGTHFQLRVHTGADFTNQLEHQAVTDHHRAVGLLGRQITHRRFTGQLQCSQVLSRLEPQIAVRGIEHGAGLHGLDHLKDKMLKAEGIGHQTYLAGASYSGQRQLLGQGAGELVFAKEAQGQLVAADLASTGHFDLAEQHRMLRVAKTHAISDVHRVDCRIFAGKPAPLGQPGGQ